MTDLAAYREFLRAKVQHGADEGFSPIELPGFLFPFQAHLVEWALRRGCAALFADCGLGKTPMQLVWADNVVRQTNGRVLVLTPLAVGHQTVREAAKFGIEAERADRIGKARITVANYERLHHFDPADFDGVVCDESSILKSFDGKTRVAVTEFLRTVRYRLLCTATAAPNDYVELGTSSEALGELGHVDMLNRFFTRRPSYFRVAHRDEPTTERDWRFKGHAEEPFWRWVCSWARACRKPSDLGFDDGGFVLPPLHERDHVVQARTLPPGMLFPSPAVGLREEREERRRTIEERCEMVARLVDHGEPAVVWCHLNAEGDRLAATIPGARQVSGADSDEQKVETYRAFADGDLRVLVIKPKIGAWGLNWQHCAHVVTFASHSYEQHYQAVRRCWRFGQQKPVTVDVVATEGEAGVAANLRRKSEAADRMFAALVEHMNRSIRMERWDRYTKSVEVPAWLSPTN